MDLRNDLEDLFQTLPISAEQLRAWCHQTMPKGKPHEISTDANRLDLLEWLIDRGRLANGQAPLLTVLRHVFTQKKIAALQSNWDRLSQKLAILEKHCIDETRAEEKFRLQSLIDATQSERDRIEQQMLKRAETLTESDPNEQRLLEQTTRHFGISAEQARPEPIPTRAEETPALLLRIWRPSPDKRCHVQGWLFYSAELHPQVCTRDADRALNLTDEQELADLLEELRKELARRGIYKRLPVEFILSLELLSQPVEQWLDEDSDPLGIKAPVVVRSRCLTRQTILKPCAAKHSFCSIACCSYCTLRIGIFCRFMIAAMMTTRCGSYGKNSPGGLMPLMSSAPAHGTTIMISRSSSALSTRVMPRSECPLTMAACLTLMNTRCWSA